MDMTSKARQNTLKKETNSVLELTCIVCKKIFEFKFDYGHPVECTHCKSLFECDWDFEDTEEGIKQWIVSVIKIGSGYEYQC